jgi:hypothetical protein
MRSLFLPFSLAALAASAPSSFADGAFYGDPPDATHPWSIHDMNRAQPARVEPGSYSTQEQPGKPPSDAIILFDGSPASVDKWAADKNPVEPTKWIVKDGTLQCVPGAGYTKTREEFGDCQLHLEWSAPAKPEGSSQGRGNSGVFLMGQVEVQVLDNFNNPTYADGFAGSVYGINPPMANPLVAPGQWQIYDIIFRRPVFKDGKEIESGYLTVFLNGVLVQDHTALEGGGGHMGRSKSHPFPEKGPLKLQDHGNPVRYRNIWYRPLPKRASEGGDTSTMSPEATAAKRKQIAASIREAAAKQQGKEQLLHLMESLTYDADPATITKVTDLATAWHASFKDLAPDKLADKKGEVLQVNKAVQYLVRFKMLPDSFLLNAPLKKLISDLGWDK